MIGALLEFGSKLFERVIPDPDKRAAAQLELLRLQQSGELAAIAGQLDVNKIEAAHPSLLVSGWRPAAGWVCVAALAYHVVLRPIVNGLVSLIGAAPVFPAIELEVLLYILGGILGLRSAEKFRGVASR